MNEFKDFFGDAKAAIGVGAFGLAVGFVASVLMYSSELVRLESDNQERANRIRHANPGPVGSLKLLSNDKLTEKARKTVNEIRQIYRAHEQRVFQTRLSKHKEADRLISKERKRVIEEFHAAEYDNALLLIEVLRSKLPLLARTTVFENNPKNAEGVTISGMTMGEAGGLSDFDFTTRSMLGYAGEIEQLTLLLPLHSESMLCSY